MRRFHNAALAASLAFGGALVMLCSAQAPPAGGRGAQTPGAQPPAAGPQGRGATNRPPAVPGGRGGPAAVPKKHLLVIGLTKGYHHGSTSDGLGMFWQLGNDSAVWDTEIRTDMNWITKKPPSSEAHSIEFFDAVAFVNTTGNWGLDDEQKQALLSYVRDDGKGLVVAHAALDANYDWPEYAEMIGGWFNAHPWGTFDAPVIVEDQNFPAMRHFPSRLMLYDEMYSAKQWSRDKVNVLMRLDESKLNYVNPQYGVARTRPDKDEAIAWSKLYGKGRVFYSSLGHTKEAWQNPDVKQMYLEGVKWVMKRTEGSTDPHPKVNPK
jgi:type 1 glutamine amidotransferase